MFDFGIGTSELLLIAMVALIVVGPRELPGLLRTLGQWVGKLKALAADFQNHLDELTKESEVKEIRKKVEQDIGDLSIEDLDREFAEIEKEMREQLAAGAKQPGGPREADDEDLIEEQERPLPQALDLDAPPSAGRAASADDGDAATGAAGTQAQPAGAGAAEARTARRQTPAGDDVDDDADADAAGTAGRSSPQRDGGGGERPHKVAAGE